MNDQNRTQNHFCNKKLNAKPPKAPNAVSFISFKPNQAAPPTTTAAAVEIPILTGKGFS